jgi:hypothetical protein
MPHSHERERWYGGSVAGTSQAWRSGRHTRWRLRCSTWQCYLGRRNEQPQDFQSTRICRLGEIAIRAELFV